MWIHACANGERYYAGTVVIKHIPTLNAKAEAAGSRTIAHTASEAFMLLLSCRTAFAAVENGHKKKMNVLKAFGARLRSSRGGRG